MNATSIKTLPKLGDHSVDVATIQAALKICVDGVFGPATQKALIEKQKAAGIDADGIIGPNTLKALGLTLDVVDPVSNRPSITKDFHGKKLRHIHPSARLLIEAKLFPGGIIKDCWRKANIAQCYIDVGEAMGRLGWHETAGNNRGTQIGWIQATTGYDEDTKGGNGDAWCMDWAEMFFAIIEDFFQVESPVPSTASTYVGWDESVKIPGLTTHTPTAGALAIGKHTGGGHAMPTLAVYGDGTMLTCEGNTSIANMTDGDGSGIKHRNQFNNGELITQGWIFTYPHNQLPVSHHG